LSNAVTAQRLLYFLRGGKFGVLPEMRRVESKDDMLSRYSRIKEQIGKRQIGFVTLNPDFAINNIGVDNDMVSALFLVPPNFTQLIMPQSIVANEFRS